MSKPTEEDIRHEAEAELEHAFRLPATFVNRCWVRIGLETTRICLGEAASPEMPPQFRIAVVMPTTEALRLAATLRTLADKLQEQVAATAQAGTDGEAPN